MSSQDPSAVEASADRDSSPDFAALRAKAKRRRLLIFSVAAVVLLGGGVMSVLISQSAARRELDAAVGELETCLFDGPLAAGESPAVRMHRLQLAVIDKPDPEREASKAWPFTCRDAAGHAADLLKPNVAEGAQKALADLVSFVSDGAALIKDPSPMIDALLPVLRAASSAPIGAGKEPLPKPAANADSLSSSSALSKKGLSRTFTEDNPGLAMPVLIDEEDLPAPLLCVFRATGEDAACRSLKELSAVHGHGLRMLGTSDPGAPNLVFAGKRGSEGIFVTGSSVPVDHMYSYGGYAAADGSVWALGWDEDAKGIVLSQKLGDKAPTRTPLKPNFRVGNYFYGSQVLWDQVLVRGITPNEERRLFVLPLTRDQKQSFDMADIGELPEAGVIRYGEEEEPHLTGCRTSLATVVRVRGDANDYLTFRINGKFTEPVRSAQYGVLGCYGNTATIVHIAYGDTGGTRISHDTCTSAGCVTTSANTEAVDGNSAELRPRELRDIGAVDLDGKLLVVWLAGEHGGLRLRVGDPDQFAHAPDTLVFDDHVLGGKVVRESTLLGFRLYSREHFAVLLLSTLAGVHAFRIDPSGALKPWQLALKE